MGKKITSEHHIVCRSRCSSAHLGKTVMLPKNFHEAWHILFQNIYEDECITFIEEVNRLMNVKNEVSSKDLHELREKIKEYRLFPKQLTKGG